jgi:hypothetical protein
VDGVTKRQNGWKAQKALSSMAKSAELVHSKDQNLMA